MIINQIINKMLDRIRTILMKIDKWLSIAEQFYYNLYAIDTTYIVFVVIKNDIELKNYKKNAFTVVKFKINEMK